MGAGPDTASAGDGGDGGDATADPTTSKASSGDGGDSGRAACRQVGGRSGHGGDASNNTTAPGRSGAGGTAGIGSPTERREPQVDQLASTPLPNSRAVRPPAACRAYQRGRSPCLGLRGRTSWPVSRILCRGPNPRGDHPSGHTVTGCLRRPHPQARASSPRTYAQPRRGAAFLALLRVGFA